MRLLPLKMWPGCLIIGYQGRIKGAFGMKTAEKAVFGFRLLGKRNFAKVSASLFIAAYCLMKTHAVIPAQGESRMCKRGESCCYLINSYLDRAGFPPARE